METGRSMELAARISALAEAGQTSLGVPVGKLYGLPELPGDGCWVDMAGVAALTRVTPKTITSWLSRGGPVRNPFPIPDRLMYRLYWRYSDIAAWLAREHHTGMSAGDV